MMQEVIRGAIGIAIGVGIIVVAWRLMTGKWF